jgi:hypothetical protein
MILAEMVINSVTHRISIEGNDPDYEWTYNWKPLIVSFAAPQYRMDQKHGGFCRLSFGAIELSPDLFDSDWPPPMSCELTVKYTATNDSATETFFTGTCHRKTISRDSIVYDLHDAAYDVDLLEEGTDYNGATVALPRAFGNVAYRKVVRLADVGSPSKPTYHTGYILGTKGIDWHVYDDGKNIDSNVTDNGDDTFSLSATPVGEVTISGTGEDTTLAEVIAWAASASYLNLTANTTNWDNSIPDLAHWADKQQKMIDFLSEVSAFFSHLVYIRTATIYLVSMGTDNGTDTITEYDFLPSKWTDAPPVAIIRSKWITRAAVEETIGKYVKDTETEAYQESSYAYGKDQSLTPFTTDMDDIKTCLAAILTTIHKPVCSLPMPLLGSLPSPGKKISWADTALGQGTDCYIRARSITYDFDNDNEEVKIEGEGVMAAA